MLKKIGKVSKAFNVLVALIFLVESPGYGLAPLPATQNPTIKAAATAKLISEVSTPARTQYQQKLLEQNGNEMVLLSNGHILVKDQVDPTDTRFLCEAVEQYYTALLKILEFEQRKEYEALISWMLEKHPEFRAIPFSSREKKIVKVVSEFLAYMAMSKGGIIEPGLARYDNARKLQAEISGGDIKAIHHIFYEQISLMKGRDPRKIGENEYVKGMNTSQLFEEFSETILDHARVVTKVSNWTEHSGRRFYTAPVPQDVETANIKRNGLLPYTGRRQSVEAVTGKSTAPLYLKEQWKNVFDSAGENEIKEVDIIASGGGGDVLGCIVLAYEMRAMLQAKHPGAEPVKINIITSNLKRGDENPPGGPLKMHWVKTKDGKRLMPLTQGGHIYPMEQEIKINTPITDDNKKRIDGYSAEVSISEEKVMDFLKSEGITLLMADAGQSGKSLAKSYLAWKGDRAKNSFVVAQDMGGDICAKFPGPIGPDNLSERAIASPNTDAVFLDMAVELENSRELDGRVIMGISALGGDGELEDTLFGYLREYYRENEVQGVMDNIRFFSERDPSGKTYKAVFEKCISVKSEVSGHFILRILAAANILPTLDGELIASFQKEYDYPDRNWFNEFNRVGKSRGFTLADISDPDFMCSEMPLGVISQTKIRNGTRVVKAPWLYSTTFFLRPSYVHGKIQDEFMKDRSKTWWEKNKYLVETLNYNTEMTDKNNKRDRSMTNRQLLKKEILAEVFRVRRERPDTEMGKFLRNKVNSIPNIFPEVKKELLALSNILDRSFSGNIDVIVNRFCFSASERKEYGLEIKKWLEKTQDKIASGGSKISFYEYSYYCAYIMEKIADVVFKEQREGRLDKGGAGVKVFFDVSARTMEALESIGGKKNSAVLLGVVFEEILPVIVAQTAAQARDGKDTVPELKEYERRLSVVKTFICKKLDESNALGDGTGKGDDTTADRGERLLKFSRSYLPAIISAGVESEEKTGVMLDILYDFFIKVDKLDGPYNVMIENKIFLKFFPWAIQIFQTNENLERFIRSIQNKIDTAVEGDGVRISKEVEYSFLFCFLDFWGKLLERKDVVQLDIDMNRISEICEGYRAVSVSSGRDYTPVLRLVIELSRKLNSMDEILEMNRILFHEVKVAEIHTYGNEVASILGIDYQFPAGVRKKLYEIMRESSGKELIDAVRKLNIRYENISRDAWEQDFNDVEAAGFEKSRQRVKKESNEKINPVKVKKIEPLDNVEDQAEISIADKRNGDQEYFRGVTLLREKKCAFGFTAGLISNMGSNLMDVDLMFSIPGTDGVARRLVEWKLYMLDQMYKIYGMDKNDPLPLVPMAGFNSDILEQLRFITDNFGYADNPDRVFSFNQGPTKAMYGKDDPATGAKRGDIAQINNKDLFASAGGWGFVKWLIISGTLKDLRERGGVEYLGHSNINNPAEIFSARLVGHFDKAVKDARAKGEEEPLFMAELGEYRGERGAIVAKVTYEQDGKIRTRGRILHQDRWTEELKKKVKAQKKEEYLFNFANYLINLEQLWKAFRLDEVYGDPGVQTQESVRQKLIAQVAEIEQERGIVPIMRRSTAADGKEVIIPDYVLDDITLLGNWMPVKVSDRDEHYVALKTVADVVDPGKGDNISKRIKKLDTTAFNNRTPSNRYVTAYLKQKGLIGELEEETPASVSQKIERIFLPSRIFMVDRALIDDEYIPGPYEQKDLRDGFREKVRNQKYRERLLRREISLLCEDHPMRFAEKNALIEEGVKLLKALEGFVTFENGRMIDGITNVESNMLVRQCVKLVFSDDPYIKGHNPFAGINRLSNDLALKRMEDKGEAMTEEDILREAVNLDRMKFYLDGVTGRVDDFDGLYRKVYEEVEKVSVSSEYKMEDMPDYLKRMTKGAYRVAYIPDDNGEIVYHLYLIQRFLSKNPELKIDLIPKGGQYQVDASYKDVIQLLEKPVFADLKRFVEQKRLSVIESSPRIGGVDLSRVSEEVKDSISNSDFIFSVGCCNYEMLNGIKKENYHLLKVNGVTSVTATGNKAGTCLFVKNVAGEKYFSTELFVIKEGWELELKEDIKESAAILWDDLYLQPGGEREYVIEYDESRFSEYQIGMIRKYAEFLNGTFFSMGRGKEKVKIRSFVPDGKTERPVLGILCNVNGKKFGMGNVNIRSKADIRDLQFRMVGVLNMIFLASHIPSGMSKEDLSAGKYNGLIAGIKAHYKMLEKKELDLSGDIGEKLSLFDLSLPDATIVHVEKQREYQEIMEEFLTAA